MKQTFKLKKHIVVVLMVGLMIGSGFLMATASKNAPVQLVPQNFSALADIVSPAVVHIRVEKEAVSAGYHIESQRIKCQVFSVLLIIGDVVKVEFCTLFSGNV